MGRRGRPLTLAHAWPPIRRWRPLVSMPVRALFFMKHPGAIRNFESVVRSLAERGHQVELAFDSVKSADSLATVERLAADHPGLSWVKAPSPARSPRAQTAGALRRGIDYLRYLEPRYREADGLRERARAEAPAPLRLAGDVARRLRVLGLLRRALARVERSLPPAPALADFLAERRPDVVLVTPLVGIGSAQADVLRAALRAGIPTVFPVHSWDNLTNKGLLRDVPDLTLVWSPAQVEEAVALHGVPSGRVEATGASAYDHWFEWAPSTTREEFARLVGLPDDRPFVLWVCSSPFIAPDEVSYVRGWLAALRAEGSPLADVGVLVRPHPQHAAQWEQVELGDPLVAVWPRGGEDPLDRDARRHYFDSIHHSGAVAGINTSAQIESAILGRPVHTVLADEFRATQGGTLHFQHIAGGDGHLIVGRSLAEHVGQLAESLARPDDTRGRRFLESFIRPYGLEEPATPRLVAAIERLAGSPSRAAGDVPAGAGLVQAALAPVERALLRRRRAAKASRPDRAAPAREAVARLAASEGPVLAGPWLAEVGYELLYWIPFLRRATELVPGLAERLVVVSRGGTEPWYHGIAARYLEVFDVLPPEQLETRLRGVTAETGGYRKQYAETSLDRELLAALRGQASLEEAAVLHPSAMFAGYRALAKSGEAPEESGLFSFAPLSAGAAAGSLPEGLPPTFTAVRFYFSATLPETEANRRLAQEAVERLAEQADVVLLTPPGSYDDHHDLELGASERVHRVETAMTPRTNLAVQTAVISRAHGFAGTYGGLSYLPLLLDVPALALHSAPRFRERHLELARRLAARPGFGRYDVRATEGLDLETALAHLTRPA